MWNPEELMPIDTARMRELDRAAIEQYAVPGLILMENAGRSIAVEALGLFGSQRPGRVRVVAGPGNNGGDGFVVARHLSNWGQQVEITLEVDPEKLNGDALVNYTIAEKMALPIRGGPGAIEKKSLLDWLQRADLVVDALLGTGTRGAVRPPFDEIIRAVNESKRPVVAVDLPSGLDADTGLAQGVAIEAALTVACGAPKKGLLSAGAARYVGRLVVAYISLPRAIEPRGRSE